MACRRMWRTLACLYKKHCDRIWALAIAKYNHSIEACAQMWQMFAARHKQAEMFFSAQRYHQEEQRRREKENEERDYKRKMAERLKKKKWTTTIREKPAASKQVLYPSKYVDVAANLCLRKAAFGSPPNNVVRDAVARARGHGGKAVSELKAWSDAGKEWSSWTMTYGPVARCQPSQSDHLSILDNDLVRVTSELEGLMRISVRVRPMDVTLDLEVANHDTGASVKIAVLRNLYLSGEMDAPLREILTAADSMAMWMGSQEITNEETLLDSGVEEGGRLTMEVNMELLLQIEQKHARTKGWKAFSVWSTQTNQMCCRMLGDVNGREDFQATAKLHFDSFGMLACCDH